MTTRRLVQSDVELPITVRCERCRGELKLWFNGGELDSKTCCGLTYELECRAVDLYVTELPRKLPPT